VAHHHHGSVIGEHARVAWWAREEGDLLNGTSRLLLAARTNRARVGGQTRLHAT
jgi:hypothetical protein